MTSKATCIFFLIASLTRAAFGANVIGCWNDAEDRAMSRASYEDWDGMTLDSCQQFCYDSGFRYAGAENGHECYCDDWYWKHGEAEHCWTLCAGDWDQACGGGWALTVMDTGYSPCNDNPCANGGNCVATGGRSYSCQCPSQWAGSNCEIYVDPCANSPCANGGACTPSGATFSCTCVAPYTGSICDIYVNPCSNNPCENGGACTPSGASFTCTCVAPYTGSNCQTYVNPCANNPCENGGTCTPSGASFTCTCVAPYTGSNCQTYVDPCANNPCENGGLCTPSGASFLCSCVAPYTGSTCQTYVDPCGNNPCKNDGKCTASGASFTCTCSVGWKGVDCSKIDDNIALNKTAYQVSNYNSAVAAWAVDGNENTASCTVRFNGPWWAIDLGERRKVRRVEIVHDNNNYFAYRLNNFYVKLTNEQPIAGQALSSDLTFCAQYNGTVPNHGTVAVTCSSSVQPFRYVVVQGSFSSPEAICLSEVRVYGD